MAVLVNCVTSVKRIAASNRKRFFKKQNSSSPEMISSFSNVKIIESHTSKENDTIRNGRESADSTPKEIKVISRNGRTF